MKQRYRVTGSRRYLGHEPGAMFVADLSPAQESRAIERGVLARMGEEEASGTTRVELDAIAEEAGVPGPSRLPNKQAVLDAINAHQGDEGGS